MAQDVRSPWSTEGNTSPSASRPIGVGPLGRADQGAGHVLRHVGKNSRTNPALMSENYKKPTPVQGQPPGVIPDSRKR
jgi:hypothetical protein